MRKIFTAIIFSTLITFLMTGCGSKYDKDVLIVREGHFDKYPNIQIGDAFDKFFTNNYWHAYTSNGTRFVDFEGDCSWADRPANLLMQFEITGEKFEVIYLDIDGVTMTREETSAIIDKIMTEY